MCTCIHVFLCGIIRSLIIHVYVGIDDARNTAKLCYRMVRDGCRLDITKCIQTQVSGHALLFSSCTYPDLCTLLIRGELIKGEISMRHTAMYVTN